ncbi:hypothetical protein QR680_005629 [Steinernema hermaphroditum]|uniref:RRM domain-containing protein n=1 Tax=Steinernema hermaphroditum TaxID=289476 RepID=A0AA39HV47_9BILA|nr:hypothetical protein QR680_005629 [Steinernema hermaphroditum]
MTNTRIYIGRLPQRASEQDVYRFFKGYGRIREVVIKNGFGFVEFSEVRDAEDAVFDLNGKELCGDRVVLEFSRRHPRDRDRGRFDDRYSRRDSRYGPPYQTPYRLLVENLSTRCSWQDLKDFMRDAGEVTYADAHKIQRREGIICFATRNSMERAMDKFQGKDINGRRIKLVDDSRRKR